MEDAQQQLGPVETAVLATLGLVSQSVMKALYAAVEDEEITKQQGMILSVRFQTEVDAAFEKVAEEVKKKPQIIKP